MREVKEGHEVRVTHLTSIVVYHVQVIGGVISNHGRVVVRPKYKFLSN
jgi:hypothetical protein